MVDAVMRSLADLGELENTLVIFTSDNGYLWASTACAPSSTPTRPR